MLLYCLLYFRFPFLIFSYVTLKILFYLLMSTLVNGGLAPDLVVFNKVIIIIKQRTLWGHIQAFKQDSFERDASN